MLVKTRATDLPVEHPVNELESATNKPMAKIARVMVRVTARFERLALNATHLSVRSFKLTVRHYLGNQLVLNLHCPVIVYAAGTDRYMPASAIPESQFADICL